MTPTQRRVWDDLVANRQAKVDQDDSHHWPRLPENDAILAADRIVKAAREYVKALVRFNVLDPRNPDCGPEAAAKIVTEHALIAAVGTAQGGRDG